MQISPQTIVLAADHGGFQLKEALKQWLVDDGYDVKDFGPVSFDKDDDYPDFGIPAAQFVAADPETRRGIFVCTSGNGMAVVANKIPGLRAIVVGHADEFANDEYAPVLALAAKTLQAEEAKQVVVAWLTSLDQPLAERHRRRVAKLTALDTGRAQ